MATRRVREAHDGVDAYLVRTRYCVVCDARQPRFPARQAFHAGRRGAAVARSIRYHGVRHAHRGGAWRCALHSGPRLSALSPVCAQPGCATTILELAAEAALVDCRAYAVDQRR